MNYFLYINKMDTIAYVLSYLDICEDEYLIDELFSTKRERTAVRAYWISQSKVKVVKTLKRAQYAPDIQMVGIEPNPCYKGYRSWYVNGKLHRTDGPARVYDDGNKEWWINGKLCEVSGPGVQYDKGMLVVR